MKLIVGLGNPGNHYNFTRHNFGFLTLDFYFKIKNLDWESSEKFGAIWHKTTSTSLGLAGHDEQVIFIKPQGYYNDSGIAVRNFAKFYKIPNQNIIVVCDDLTLDFGKVRLREKGSAGGNNGLKSTIKELGTDNFPRLKLGTNNSMRQKIGDTDFVLGKFTPKERESLPPILREACLRLDELI